MNMFHISLIGSTITVVCLLGPMASSFSLADLTPDEYEQLSQIRARKMQLLDEIQHLQDELAKTNERIESITRVPDRSKSQAVAKKKFNENYRKGLKHLVETGDGIKKSAIGDFLGEKDELNLEVLQHFVCLQALRSLPLVQAMRDFLLRFRLPGEAQKIDRIMECFARHYCSQNSEVFDHPDTCYTLCYAIIMLNTSLHNPSVKERMTLDNFSLITDSMNVSRALITDIYNSIRSEAFKFPDDDLRDHCSAALFQQAEKQGWLQKQGNRYKTWNRRWFVLANRCLYYFEFPSSREPKGIIPLESIRVRVLGQEIETGRRSHAFELYSPNTDLIKACKQNGEGRLLEGQHSTYRISAPSREEMHAWISAIQRSINKDQNIENVLEKRRRRIASGGLLVAKSSMATHQRGLVDDGDPPVASNCGDDDVNNNNGDCAVQQR
uniref:Cytohesin-1 n=1 Tax=Globodera rostochiensis TaxID=31243 RepID=A0A914GSC5_GLORO